MGLATALSGGAVVDRVTERMEDRRTTGQGRASLVLAAWLTVVALGVVAALPAATLSSSSAAVLIQHCAR